MQNHKRKHRIIYLKTYTKHIWKCTKAYTNVENYKKHTYTKIYRISQRYTKAYTNIHNRCITNIQKHKNMEKDTMMD